MTTITLQYGILTNEHAASSHGQPVLVHNGVAHGATDMMDMGPFGPERAYEHGRRAVVPKDGLDAEQVALMAKWISLGRSVVE